MQSRNKLEDLQVCTDCALSSKVLNAAAPPRMRLDSATATYIHLVLREHAYGVGRQSYWL